MREPLKLVRAQWDSACRSDYIVSDIKKRMYKVMCEVINIHPSFAFQDNLLFDVYIMIALMIGFRIISFLFLLMRAYREQWFGQTSSLLRSWEAKLDLQDNEYFYAAYEKSYWRNGVIQQLSWKSCHGSFLPRKLSSTMPKHLLYVLTAAEETTANKLSSFNLIQLLNVCHNIII